MRLKKSLEIEVEHYEPTIEVLKKNGLNFREQFHGSRRILYSGNSVCGYVKTTPTLPLSGGITDQQFFNFLASFNKSLQNKLRNDVSLWSKKILFEGKTKDKCLKNFNKIKVPSIFYQIDFSSAYWQMAYRLGYISKKLFDKYMFDDRFKQAKRYCISFLARQNHMRYYDGRQEDLIICDNSAFKQVYENIRNEMYRLVSEVRNHVPNWIEYNVDSISVMEKDLETVKNLYDEWGIFYKVEECIKIDSKEYSVKGMFKNYIK